MSSSEDFLGYAVFTDGFSMCHYFSFDHYLVKEVYDSLCETQDHVMMIKIFDNNNNNLEENIMESDDEILVVSDEMKAKCDEGLYVTQDSEYNTFISTDKENVFFNRLYDDEYSPVFKITLLDNKINFMDETESLKNISSLELSYKIVDTYADDPKPALRRLAMEMGLPDEFEKIDSNLDNAYEIAHEAVMDHIENWTISRDFLEAIGC